MADRAGGGVGNIGSAVAQAEIESLLDDVELLALDNLSSLTVGVRENSRGWMRGQNFCRILALTQVSRFATFGMARQRSVAM
jgi:hypothetical protein